MTAAARQSIDAPADESAPVDALAPDYYELMNIREVEAITGLKKTAIYERITAGTFPRARQLGPNCVRWYRGAVRDWGKALPVSGAGA